MSFLNGRIVGTEIPRRSNAAQFSVGLRVAGDGDLERAAEEGERAIAIDPNFSVAYYNAAFANIWGASDLAEFYPAGLGGGCNRRKSTCLTETLFLCASISFDATIQWRVASGGGLDTTRLFLALLRGV
jgi:hypothetical protein